jgi:alpha-ketoglutarate-dependent taurine dioxygenase
LEFRVWTPSHRVEIPNANEITERYALYSSLSPGFQTYLEGLTAVHSATFQADGNRAAGLPVRRQEIETIHPVVRVHPVTGWKSVYINHGMYLFWYEDVSDFDVRISS